MFSRLVRFCVIVYWLLAFFLRAWRINLQTRDHIRRRKRLALNTSFIAKKLIKPFGLNVRIATPEKLHLLSHGNHLIIANHVSYTDILVMASWHPFVFITSTDMASNPLLGDITRMGGSLYTNRKQRTSLPQEIRNFSDCLRQSFDVVLFPEGTSTNGVTLRSFRSSLFQTSLTAQKPLLPICVRYLRIDGKPMDDSNRDIVCWYGDMSFLPHFWELIRHRIEVEVSILDEIPYDNEWNRQTLCNTVYTRLHDAYHKDGFNTTSAMSLS